MEGIYAMIYRAEDGEFLATEVYGFRQFYFPNRGIGFEFEEGQRIIILTTKGQEEHQVAEKFYKINETYELESEDGLNYTVFRLEKAGDELLVKEEIRLLDLDVAELPREIKLKILLFNKKRSQKERELHVIYEEIIFSFQNQESLYDIKEEFAYANIQFYIEEDGYPYLTIEKDGVIKPFHLNWTPDYHKKILKDNKMVVPLALAEQEIQEIVAEDLIITDIRFLEDGHVVINGVKYSFKKKKDKRRLKELNPLLYDKICLVAAGKALKEKDPKEMKKKYQELFVLTEDGEIEEHMEEAIDPLTVRSFQNYLERLMAFEVDGPVHTFKLGETEIRYYLGDQTNLSPNEFQALAKEILTEKLRENEEFNGWDGAENLFIQEYVKKHKIKTSSLHSKLEDEM